MWVWECWGFQQVCTWYAFSSFWRSICLSQEVRSPFAMVECIFSVASTSPLTTSSLALRLSSSIARRGLPAIMSSTVTPSPPVASFVFVSFFPFAPDVDVGPLLRVSVFVVRLPPPPAWVFSSKGGARLPASTPADFALAMARGRERPTMTGSEPRPLFSDCWNIVRKPAHALIINSYGGQGCGTAVSHQEG